MHRTRCRLTLLAACGFAATAAGADPVPRVAPAAGSVVATKLGEEIEFVEAPAWRGVEVLQEVKTGDVLRTNSAGQLAILFSDQTQIRVGRNSTLIVKERVPGGDTKLVLQSGQIFGRAARGGSGVFVETAAATAAIRGTDWAMQAEGSRTTLSVLDGEVQFSNPQGSVTVRQGEAAAATLGEAPTKNVIVADDVHEQMLVNVSLRSAFESFPTTPLPNRRLLQEQRRLAAIPAGSRSAEDRVLAAEIAADRDGRKVAERMIADARQGPLTAARAARLTLLQANIAAGRQRYAEAVRLYEAALPQLSGERRTTATYFLYYARSLADPRHVPPAPRPDPNDRISVAGEAVIAAILKTPREALQILLDAEPRFSNDPEFEALLSKVAMFASDYKTAKRAADRAYALDPDDPEVLSARADYRANAESDLKGAIADLERGLALAPGNTALLNVYGLALAERGAMREAEAALLRAVEIDPEDPINRANLAMVYLAQGRVAEARAMTDAVFEADPSFTIAYMVRGTQQLLEGEEKAALDSLLKASATNPAYSDVLLTLGEAYAANGDIEHARQAFDDADRLDPNSVLAAQYLAALAVDQYQADDAIEYAHRAVERIRARGGDYQSIHATRDSGSALASAYGFLSLDAWGNYWSELVFDPFESAGYFDRALYGTPAPFSLSRGDEIAGPDADVDSRGFSLLTKGILGDALSLAGSNLRPSFVTTPFTEFSFSGGVLSRAGQSGGVYGAGVQSLGYDPLPYSMMLQVSGESTSPDYADQDDDNYRLVGGFGLQVTPYDRVAGFVSAARGTGNEALEAIPFTRGDTARDDTFLGTLGFSHTFGYHNVLDVAVFGVRNDGEQALVPLELLYQNVLGAYAANARQDLLKASASHIVGFEPFTLEYGGEYGGQRSQTAGELYAFDAAGIPRLISVASSESRSNFGRAWIDATFEATDALRFEAGLFGSTTETDGAERDEFLAPRFGAAYMPVEGQWLRAGFLRERPEQDSYTLAPIGVVGLRSNALGGGVEHVDTSIVRLDSEWSRHLFTAVEYQHQDFAGLAFEVPGYIDAVTVDDARLDRLSLTVNSWLGGGFGASATLARSWSKGTVAGATGDIPYVPDWGGNVALTYVDPSRIKVTARETYLGHRESHIGNQRLDDAFVTDVFGSWESEDRHLAVDLGVYNLFDEAVEVAPLVPTAQRTIRATMQARF
ncbi:FecR domain-containing protein [Jiella sonneratiae]|uniref:Tetratricopeptide repeat protein n=1 Tax=Jiella sonneratiae TaxID=2816856 RepID=A0ABS3J1D6_9HYPH|nr:FecR domain-containing protein [Jiella sonneratiae]MBO0902366.1 tetratricopeptide repeat protein [Jiella sonneratiae]